MVIADTSVWVDLFIPKNKMRSEIADEIFGIVEEREIEIYAPKIFVVEFISIINRLAGNVSIAINILDKINLLDEITIFETAKDIAFKTHPRAADAYFIATAKLTDSILITNDKIMSSNAKKYGIECYYLIEEFEKAIEKIRAIKA